MRFSSKFKSLIFACAGLLCIDAQASCGVPDSLTVLSLDFSSKPQDTITDITVSNPFNPLQLNLSGGYVSQIGQDFVWKLAPQGSYEVGESTGEASIRFDPDARYLNASFSVPDGTFLRLQLFNDLGTLMHEFSVESEELYEFESPDNSLSARDISELKLIIDGGSEPVTLSAVFFSTPPTVCADTVSTGGSSDWFTYFAILSLLLLSKSNTRKR